MRIFANVKTSINRYKDYRTMTKDDLADFYQSKCDYYQEYVWVCLVVGTILSVFYIVPDYMLNGSIIPTLIPRLTVLGILLLFLIVLHFSHSRAAIVTADYFLVHSIIVTTICAAHFLGHKTLASEFFLIMNLIFLIAGFVARIREITVSYIIFFLEILISHFIIRYENFPIIMILIIPCGLAVIFSHVILTFLYLDHYRLSQKLELAMITDPLTQVYNRHLLEKIVTKNALMNMEEPIAIAMLDLLNLAYLRKHIIFAAYISQKQEPVQPFYFPHTENCSGTKDNQKCPYNQIYNHSERLFIHNFVDKYKKHMCKKELDEKPHASCIYKDLYGVIQKSSYIHALSRYQNYSVCRKCNARPHNIRNDQSEKFLFHKLFFRIFLKFLIKKKAAYKVENRHMHKADKSRKYSYCI